MAKNALGRGLGSLMNNSFEEEKSPIPDAMLSQPKKQPKTPQEAPAQPAQPAAAAKPAPRAVGQPAERVRVESPEIAQRPAVRVREVPVQELVDEVVTEENVTIKKVSARVPDELPIDKIVPNPNQPRINFKKEELEELAASIAQDGLLQPILVRPAENGMYQIVAGERRWRACGLAGLSMVPVRVKDVSDEKILELALVENIQRSDLNPIEEAYGYRRLMEKNNLTQAEVAQLVSKGRSTVANALRLLELPEDAQQLLYEEKITAGHARAILSVPTKEGRQKLTEKMVNEKISVREAEQIARLFAASASGAAATPREPMPNSYKKVARTLRTRLDTGVKIKTSQGRNRIEIEFKDEEDLQRVFACMFEEMKAKKAEQK